MWRKYIEYFLKKENYFNNIEISYIIQIEKREEINVDERMD